MKTTTIIIIQKQNTLIICLPIYKMRINITGLCMYKMCEMESQTAFQDRTTVVVILLKAIQTIQYSLENK